MIVRSHRVHSLALLFACQGSIIPTITPKILLAAFIGLLAVLIEDGVFGNERNPAALQMSLAPFTSLGIAISLFLGFHNNASYGRWWEARILWGRQIIVVRNLIRFLMGSLGDDCERDEWNDTNSDSHAPPEEEQAPPRGSSTAEEQPISDSSWRRQIVRLSMAQAHALRAQLRPYCHLDEPGSALADRNKWLTTEELNVLDKSHNPANAISARMGGWIGRAFRQGDLDSFSRVHLSRLLEEICQIQASCERIYNTSLPWAYSLLVHRTATLYVLFTPFAIVEQMGWWTPVFTAILAYTFFGLDELARQIQEPFSDEPHCLALSALCRTIELDVSEALGRDPPPALAPHKSVLM